MNFLYFFAIIILNLIRVFYSHTQKYKAVYNISCNFKLETVFMQCKIFLQSNLGIILMLLAFPTYYQHAKLLFQEAEWSLLCTGSIYSIW